MLCHECSFPITEAATDIAMLDGRSVGHTLQLERERSPCSREDNRRYGGGRLCPAAQIWS